MKQKLDEENRTLKNLQLVLEDKINSISDKDEIWSSIVTPLQLFLEEFLESMLINTW